MTTWLAFAFVVHHAPTAMPFLAQYGGHAQGQLVRICLDGRKVSTTFAGKLGFRSERGDWLSVCADVRTPVRAGQTTKVRALSSKAVGGNIALAGNIVAKHFGSAKTADQCAGLQLAVWEAIEDGGANASFGQGRFQAQASVMALQAAQEYYPASKEVSDSTYIKSAKRTQNQLSTAAPTPPTGGVGK